MTSEPGHTSCYVYIALPGEQAFVPAARFRLEPDPAGEPTGYFRYGQTYLARPDAVELDPVDLRLGDQIYSTESLRGIFGALRDAGPDHWGRRIIERHQNSSTHGEVDYLLLSPDDRAGALGFGLSPEPPAPHYQFNKILDLYRLQEIADAIIADRDLPPGATAEQVNALILAGTSMGGARPKVVVEDENGLWLAKFNRSDDRWNMARVEHAMLLLARECGIRAADSRVTSAAGRDVLLVRRFDRELVEGGYRRFRMVSGLTLLRADDGATGRERWSYPLLVEALRKASGNPTEDAKELFRRMCFNALISNADDHPRNHALLAPLKQWHLSPAFDLTPFPQVSVDSRDLALVCGHEGRLASEKNLLTQHARFLLSREEAVAIIHDMHQVVYSRWLPVARACAVTQADCDRISNAFCYPGFGLNVRRP